MIVLLTPSCQKYVDIPTNSTTGRLETAKDCQLLLDNDAVMNEGYPNDGELSADDLYLKDEGFQASTLDQSDRDLYVWSKNAIRASSDPQWLKPYYTVYYANLVLEQVDKLESKGGADQITLNTLRGSALFFRAFAFWQLAQIYAPPYSTTSSNQDLGLPLKLNSDISQKPTRSSVSDTYLQILKDLNESSNLLPETSLVPTRPNKAAAYAMLARVYLSKEDYSEAFIFSNLSLKLNNKLLSYSSLQMNDESAFFNAFNNEVIFHAVTNGNSVAINPFDIGRIDPELCNLYQDNDLRKTVIIAPVGDGSFRFIGNYAGGTASSKLFVGLATDELYLIRAECNARANRVVEAMEDLNILLKNRFTEPYTDLTAADSDKALTYILMERRKELLMRGLRWTDLRRLNRDTHYAKTLKRIVMGDSYILPPNDIRYTLLIPNEVIVNGIIPQNVR